LVYSTRRRALEEVPHRVAVGIVARAAGEFYHRAAPERANDDIPQDRQIRDPRRQRLARRQTDGVQ